MKRLGAIVVTAVLLAGAVVLVVLQLVPEDSVSKATVDQAVLRFRAEMKKSARYPKRPDAELPPWGVYRYRTNGSESIDTTAFSTAHNYDGESTITLTPSRCGATERWQPLVERWTEGDLCAMPHSTRVVAVRDFHQFFERAKEVSYECTGGVAPYAKQLRPGLRWQTKCVSEQGTVTSNVEVVGLEKIEVAGKGIDAVHLEAKVSLDGDPDGSDTRDSWLRRSDGLLLRRVDRSMAHVDVSGGAEFEEHYELTLLSTKPQL